MKNCTAQEDATREEKVVISYPSPRPTHPLPTGDARPVTCSLTSLTTFHQFVSGKDALSHNYHPETTLFSPCAHTTDQDYRSGFMTLPFAHTTGAVRCSSFDGGGFDPLVASYG
jgi:hypothetical protein